MHRRLVSYSRPDPAAFLSQRHSFTKYAEGAGCSARPGLQFPMCSIRTSPGQRGQGFRFGQWIGAKQLHLAGVGEGDRGYKTPPDYVLRVSSENLLGLSPPGAHQPGAVHREIHDARQATHGPNTLPQSCELLAQSCVLLHYGVDRHGTGLPLRPRHALRAGRDPQYPGAMRKSQRFVIVSTYIM
jgi:hypothetical protein